MSATRSFPDAGAGAAPPLLNGGHLPRQPLRAAARLLCLAAEAGGRRRRASRDPQLARGWSRSGAVVALNVLWKLSSAAGAAAVLVRAGNEKPEAPLRTWVLVHSLQCLVRVVCVVAECWLWRIRGLGSVSSLLDRRVDGWAGNGDYGDAEPSVLKSLESASTMFSFFWWITGLYWVSSSGQNITQDATQLYWTCIFFLVFDAFFVVLCLGLACIVGAVACCCLPCIIAILYIVAIPHEGASAEDIRLLPKYMFRSAGNPENFRDGVRISDADMIEYGTDQPIECFVQPDDEECCICLSAYEDGVELHKLPCGHHFHCVCVDKWLRINATCPLCKYSLAKDNDAVDEV